MNGLLQKIQSQLNGGLTEKLTLLFCETLRWGSAKGMRRRELKVGTPVNMTLTAHPVAQLSGLPVFRLDWPEDRLPTITARRAVQRVLEPVHADHLLCYVSRDQKQAAFTWARTRLDGKTEIRTLPYEVGAPARTTIERLGELAFSLDELAAGEPPITAVTDKLNRAFDVEAVTKQFYQEIANWYFWALDHARFPKDAPKLDGKDHVSLIRLITRLIFCWFLKEKGLIPSTLFDLQKLPVILNGFAPDEARDKASVFYKAILQNMFFATLNTEMDQRGWAKDEQNFMAHSLYRHKELFRHPASALELFKNIPFLNGGLFECLDRIEGTKDKPRYIRIDGFSRRPDSQPVVPDFLFFGDERMVDLSQAYGEARYRTDDVRGLIRTLAGYNFTLTENTPLDQEVALDPELLGKVFENLLAAYNPETRTTARKATGSYYTPREIVDYMVDEALIAALTTKLKAAVPHAPEVEARLRQLFAYNEEPHRFSEQEVEALIEAIDHLKILDPACGSGAFPMGVLHKLVFVLGKLDPRNERWKERQIARVRETMAAAEKIEDVTVRERTLRELEQQIVSINDAFTHNELDYGRKLYLIENCIYGVDIQPIAVQIAKLRFFISLVVDQRVNPKAENLGIRALPNLETKFVAANTLIGLDRPKQLALRNPRIDELERELVRVREAHFTARTPATKRKYRKRDASLRAEIAELLKHDSWGSATAAMLAAWDPYDQNASAGFFDAEWMFGVREGFDITIGNPPWGQKAVEFSNEEKKHFRQNYLTAQGVLDIFKLFCECGLRLTRMNGAWTMILPDIILLKNYEETRRIFLSETAIEIIAHTGMAFEAAQIDTVVIVARKIPQSQSTTQKIKAIHDFRGVPDQEPDLVLPQSLFWKLDRLKFNIYLSPERLAILEKLQELPKLGEFFHAHEGIHSGNIREKLFLDAPISKSCRRLIFGRDEIAKYRVNWRGKWVNYDLAAIDREAGEYANLGHSQYFEQPKIFIRRTGDFVMTALDKSGLYASNNLFVALPNRSSSKLSLEALTGVLNSRLMTWFFRTIQPRVGKLFAELKINQIHQFPLPLANRHREATETLSPLVNRILAAKRRDPQADVTTLEREIDERVYRLYGLTPEEIKIVEEG